MPRPLIHIPCALWIAAGLWAAPPAGPETDAPWPIFRGETHLRGLAAGKLPEKPAVLWTFKTDGPIRSSPVVGRGKVYIGSDDQNVHALDRKTGRQAWKFATEDIIESAPTLHGDALLVGGNDGFLYCLDADQGRLRWKYQTQDKVIGSAVVVRSGDKDLAIVGSFDARLHAVNLADGKPAWVFETDSPINSTPTVVNGRILFGGCDGNVHIVAVDKGQEIKKIEIGNYIAASAPWADNRLYVGHFGNAFVCVDLVSDKIVWTYKDKNFPYYSSAAVDDRYVVFGGRDKRLHCLNRADGSVVWTFATRGSVDSSPVIAGDRVIVGSEDGRLYIVSLKDGQEAWSYEIGKPVMGSPAVVAGVIYIGAEDGNVYAFADK